jgi:hypothetical protein
MGFLDLFKRPERIEIETREDLRKAESRINEAQASWEKLPTFVIRGDVYAQSEDFWLWWDGRLNRAFKDGLTSLPGLLLESPLALAKIVGKSVVAMLTKNRVLDEKMEEGIPDAEIRNGIDVILSYDYRFGGIYRDKREVLIVARTDTYDG